MVRPYFAEKTSTHLLDVADLHRKDCAVFAWHLNTGQVGELEYDVVALAKVRRDIKRLAILCGELDVLCTEICEFVDLLLRWWTTFSWWNVYRMERSTLKYQPTMQRPEDIP